MRDEIKNLKLITLLKSFIGKIRVITASTKLSISWNKTDMYGMHKYLQLLQVLILTYVERRMRTNETE